MKQEPVAWMIKTDQEGADIAWDKEQLEDITEFYKDECWEFEVIPLYTAPRELSDEEIIGAIARGWCSEKNSSKTMDSDLAMAIADEIKAILKKASEK